MYQVSSVMGGNPTHNLSSDWHPIHMKNYDIVNNYWLTCTLGVFMWVSVLPKCGVHHSYFRYISIQHICLVDKKSYTFLRYHGTLNVWVRVMVFNPTFNNISAISWRSVLLVEETRVPRENHRPAASHWQTLSHNVVLSTPCLSKS